MNTTVRGIGISGKKGSGKTTLADALHKRILLEGCACQRGSFAGGLKHISRVALLSLGVELEDDWKYKYRTLLQAIGQAGRDLYQDLWVDLLLKSREKNAPFMIVDDVRHTNEAEALRKAGFILIRLDLTNAAWASRGLVPPGQSDLDRHISEVALDDYMYWNEQLCVTVGDSPELLADIIVQKYLK